MAGSLLILGAGYLGAAIAARALAAGDEVTLADNWFATERVAGRGRRGRARRRLPTSAPRATSSALLAERRSTASIFTAAQASRPLSFADPDYTEQTNLVGARRVAQAVARRRCVFASSLHVYGGGLSGAVGADRPYGEQGDLAHLSKVYAELVLKMEARRRGFPLVAAAARHRLRPVAGRARPARVGRPSSTSSAAWPPPASRCRSTTAAARRSASSTSTTPRGSSTRRATRSRTSRPRRSPSATSRRSPRAASPPAERPGPSRARSRTSTPSRSTCAR